MNAQIRKISRDTNGSRSLYIRIPSWMSFTLVILTFTVIVNTVIFVYSTQARMKEYDSNWEYQFRFNEGVKNCMWKFHQKDITDEIPSSDKVSKGGASAYNFSATYNK